MKQHRLAIALLCGLTIICSWSLGALLICERIALPGFIEVPFAIGTIVASIYFCIFIVRMADEAGTYGDAIDHATRQADLWLSAYEQAHKDLTQAEDELFDLQQAHSELGAAYNELKDILLENDIYPDGPYTF